MRDMKKLVLYVLWLCMYIICVGMGTLTERTTALHILLSVLALLFFVPGILLLIHGFQTGDQKLLLQVRLISLASLVLTLCLIIVNIAAVQATEGVGNVLNELLILVSAPMFCAYWRVASLFLWACLFVSSFPRMWKK